MSIRSLPKARTPSRPRNFQPDMPSDVLARWADMPQLAASEDPASIDIFDVIGEDFWSGGGCTEKRMSAALRSIGAGNPVVVNINSPGGDMWAGIAIYNMLAAHKGKVTVNVMALAASAASVIAMAGDEIRMATGSQMMIHNAWGVVVGNKNDMRAAADVFDGFDASLAEIYQARTGNRMADIVAAMDAETFMSAEEAVRAGYADAAVDFAATAASASARHDPAVMARRQIDAALARSHYSRSDRQQLVAALGAPRDASSEPGAQRDASAIHQGLRALIDTLSQE